MEVNRIMPRTFAIVKKSRRNFLFERRGRNLTESAGWRLVVFCFFLSSYSASYTSIFPSSFPIHSYFFFSTSWVFFPQCNSLKKNRKGPFECTYYLCFISLRLLFSCVFEFLLQIQLHRAVGLASADIGGASDPFAIIELNNQRVISQTIYKTLNPSWEKVYEMWVIYFYDISTMDGPF